MNHLGDTNKMVSETPRTEAEVNRQKCWPDNLVTIDANFACQLERELNAANERIPLLIAERDTARRQADQNYKLREEFTELLGTDDVERGVAVVRGLQERIKRMEEAGDLMVQHFYTDEPRSEMWEKAKEAKP